jgi:hypothetical protein
MYTGEILKYLIWPAFILVSWFAVKFALSLYEGRDTGNETSQEEK